MLGVLQVNMPLLYGEGSTAFFRLQTELLRKSNDQSIFVWGLRLGRLQNANMPAKWPVFFADSSQVSRSGDSGMSYTMMHRGLELHVPAKMWLVHPVNYTVDTRYERQMCGFLLDCEVARDDGSRRVPCVKLVLREDIKQSTIWVRSKIALRSADEIESVRMSSRQNQGAKIIQSNYGNATIRIDQPVA